MGGDFYVAVPLLWESKIHSNPSEFCHFSFPRRCRSYFFHNFASHLQIHKQLKNYVYHAFLLTAILLGCLLLLGFLSPITIAGYTFKDIDMLSDLRTDDAEATDSSLLILPAFSDTCKADVQCIEDYSPDAKGMSRFLAALDSSANRSVRIAFLGDSFVEGDILTQDLREGLQAQFGGRGVGFVPATNVLAGARKTVTISSNGIESHWLVDSIAARREAGMNGSYYFPVEGSNISYQASAYRKYIDTFSTVSLLYQNRQGASKVSYTINRSDRGFVELPKANHVGLATARGNIGRVYLSFSSTGGLKLYGALLGDPTGVYVDNMAMRGSSGYAILNVPKATLRATDSLLDYRLIIIQSGLNVANATERKFTNYKTQLTKVVTLLKESFPCADILILGVSDRSTMKGGKYVTMPGIPYLVSAQREVAVQTGVLFWDTYAAMGGENSMPKLVSARPAQAAKDYTHLSNEGGRMVAGKLLDALLYKKEMYDERKEYERQKATLEEARREVGL